MAGDNARIGVKLKLLRRSECLAHPIAPKRGQRIVRKPLVCVGVDVDESDVGGFEGFELVGLFFIEVLDWFSFKVFLE